VKSLVAIVVVVLVVALTAAVARAHPDTLGTADPSWQSLTNGRVNGGGQIAADSSTAIVGGGHPWLLRGYLYAVGAVFVTFAVGLLYLSWGRSPAICTIEVMPPSYAGEDVWVVAMVAFILLCATSSLALRGGLEPDAQSRGRSATDRLSFQILFRDLPFAEQRVFREMQEGLTEAMGRRASTGSWPTVEALAQADIPPFAPDPLDKAAVRWTIQRDGLIVNYHGVPTAGSADSPEFLILVQEPDPATAQQVSLPSLGDEEHQLLPDGMLLHVSYWERSPAPAASRGPFGRPELLGWLQIRVNAPFQTPEGR